LHHLAEITGVPVILASTDRPQFSALDPFKRQSLVGRCEIGWRDGYRRAIATFFPEYLKD
jgi:hypothetical protein